MTAPALRGMASNEPPAVEPSSAVGFEPGEVYSQHFRYVWRCLRSLGLRADELDDAMQDVFVVVHRKLAQFDGRAAIKTWLYAIAIRVARRHIELRRRERPEVTLDRDDAEVAAPSRDAEAELVQTERLELARRALHGLDQDKREVFVLAQVEQLSAPEIATVLGIPVNTVYSRLRVARAEFSARIERELARTRRSP